MSRSQPIRARVWRNVISCVLLTGTMLLPFWHPASASPGQGDRSLETGGEPRSKGSAEKRAEVWSCTGDAQEPDIVRTPPYVPNIAYVATQQCVGTFVLQSTCVRLEEWSDATSRWLDRTRWRCGPWVSGPLSVGSGTVKCSQVGHGKYRTAGRGEVETKSGVHKKVGYSRSATLC